MTAPWIFDSHCHFDFEAFDLDRDDVWRACVDRKLCGLVVPGVSPDTWQRAVSMAEAYPGMYFSVGLHPWWVDAFNAEHVNIDVALAQLRQRVAPFLSHPLCVAIGECGLDKSLELPMVIQQQVFAWHCDLAKLSDKPLVIHSLKSHDHVLRTLREYGIDRGVIHGFSGSAEQALAYARAGLCLGVGGTITYPRASKTREAIRRLPLDALVLETDAPDMPLSGRQGQRNSPLYLPEIASALADLREEPLEQICHQTTANTCKLFNIPYPPCEI